MSGLISPTDKRTDVSSTTSGVKTSTSRETHSYNKMSKPTRRRNDNPDGAIMALAMAFTLAAIGVIALIVMRVWGDGSHGNRGRRMRRREHAITVRGIISYNLIGPCCFFLNRIIHFQI